MKKRILLTALVASIVITCSILLSDGLTYIVTSLMALFIIGVIRTHNSKLMKLTRWAKSHPKKAQWLITGLLLALLILGIIEGKNLKELDYHFSDITACFFCAVMVIGLLSVPFLPRRKTIAIPFEVDRHRLAYLGISLSILVMAAILGNRIGDVYPNSAVAYAIDRMDQWIFSDKLIDYLGYNEGSTLESYDLHSSQSSAGGFATFAVFVIDPDQGTKTVEKRGLPDQFNPQKILNKPPFKKEFKKSIKEARKKLREDASGGIVALGVFLIIILIGVTCAGICLAIGAWGVTGLGAVIAGILVTGLAIFAIVKVVQWVKKNKTAQA